MYTLRIIIEERENPSLPFEQVIHNYDLGASYSRVRKGTRNFNRIMDELYPEVNKDEVESIICSENEKEWFIQKNTENKTFAYFIMSDNGNTFERLN